MDERVAAAKDSLSKAAPAGVEIVYKSMFGGVSAYSQERVFATINKEGVLALKLTEADQEELLGVEGAERLKPATEAIPNKHYIVVPPSFHKDHAAFGAWIKRSVDYVHTLPVKPKKAKKTKKKGE